MTTPETLSPGDLAALRCVAQFLEKEPEYYKNFSVYWWRLKELLKQAGHTQEQLQILGDYTEVAQRDRFASMPIGSFLDEAFEEQDSNVALHRNEGTLIDPETGDVVVIFDQDLGL